MTFIDLLVALYPLYLSIESLKKPKLETLKHCVTFWVLWFELIFATNIFYTLFWWLPFTSVLDFTKLLLLLLAYKEKSANLISYLLHKPLCDKLTHEFIKIYKIIRLVVNANLPYFKEKIDNYEKNFKHWLSLFKNLQKPHFVDNANIPPHNQHTK